MEEPKVSVKQMREGIFLLDEGGISTGYLVIGTKKACVIDTMNGFTNLPELAKQYTDLPLMVVNTHGHPDHIYGNIYFDKAYVHPADKPMVEQFTKIPEFVAAIEQRGAKFPPMEDILEGETIDLGGRTLKTYLLPGHTPGSLLLLCPEERILFTGDAINHHLWMQVPGALSITQMVQNLEKLMFLEKEADLILHGHAHDFDDISLMSALLNGAREIIAGKTEKDTPYKWGTSMEEDSENNGFGGNDWYHPFSVDETKHFQQPTHGICYRKDNI